MTECDYCFGEGGVRDQEGGGYIDCPVCLCGEVEALEDRLADALSNICLGYTSYLKLFGIPLEDSKLYNEAQLVLQEYDDKL